MLNKEGERIGIKEIRTLEREARTPEQVNAIVAQIYDEDPATARNAAWVMTHFAQYKLAMIKEREDEFVDVLLATDNDSLRRLLLNVVDKLSAMRVRRLMKRKRKTMPEFRVDLLDFCLEHMASPTEAPGIQSLCMKMAYRISRFTPELLNEFREILELMPTEGYAISIRGLRKKMLTSLCSAIPEV